MSLEVLEKKDNIENYKDKEHKVNVSKKEKWTVWEFLSNFGIDFSQDQKKGSEEKKTEKKEIEEKKLKKKEVKKEEKKEENKIEEKSWKTNKEKKEWFFKKLFSKNKKEEQKIENKDWEKKESSIEKENLSNEKNEKPWFFAGVRQIVKNAREIAKEWDVEWKLEWKELKKSELNQDSSKLKKSEVNLPSEINNEKEVFVEKNETIWPVTLLKNMKEINENSPDTRKAEVAVFENKENPDEKLSKSKKE